MNSVERGYKYAVKSKAEQMLEEARKAFTGDGSKKLKETGPAFRIKHNPNDAYKKVKEKIP